VQNRTKDLGLFLQEHRWEVQPLPTKQGTIAKQSTDAKQSTATK